MEPEDLRIGEIELGRLLSNTTKQTWRAKSYLIYKKRYVICVMCSDSKYFDIFYFLIMMFDIVTREKGRMNILKGWRLQIVYFCFYYFNKFFFLLLSLIFKYRKVGIMTIITRCFCTNHKACLLLGVQKLTG